MKNIAYTFVRFSFLLALTLVSLSCSKKISPGASKPENGQQVIEAMYNRWEDKWYPNFAFDQRAIFYNDGKVSREEVWQEIYSHPANLHIRFDGFETGNGIVYHQDTVYSFKEGRIQTKRYSIHPLVLLSFDVYFYKPATTISKLQELNFDLSQVSETRWQGRDAYVVGTSNPSDSTSNQFWVDKEMLYVLRVITNNKGGVSDVEMNRYQLVEGNWVATEIIFKNNGKLVLREEYYNMSFPKEVNQNWFDPNQFSTTRWK
jgi:hypothetical protein